MNLGDVSVEEQIAEIQSVVRDLMALGLKIPSRYFQFSDNRIVKFFANSEGSRIRSYSPRLRVFYFLTITQDGQVDRRTPNKDGPAAGEGTRRGISGSPSSVKASRLKGPL